MQVQDDILEKFLLKDKNAFELIFKTYYQQLCSFSQKYVTDPDVAEGIVQDLFVYLWQNMDRLLINTSLKSYLFQAVRNRAFNHLKHLKTRQEHTEYTLHNEQGFTSSEKTLEIKDLQKKIDSGIAQLPDKCRQIFLMSRSEGKKYKQIAEELGISIKTVENQMGKALKIMRSELGDYLPIALLIMLDLLS
jgi:RNA polymerase sigma-70 factor (ECF subfamily)